MQESGLTEIIPTHMAGDILSPKHTYAPTRAHTHTHTHTHGSRKRAEKKPLPFLKFSSPLQGAGYSKLCLPETLAEELCDRGM